MFTSTNVKKIVEEEKLEKYSDGMKRAGAIWTAFTDKEKKKYEDLAVKDRKRFETQSAELSKKGFFKMDDGSKSSDHKAKPKKRSRGVAAVVPEVEEEEEEEIKQSPKKR